MTDKPLARNEGLKTKSHYLRGTLAEGLDREITGEITEDDQQLVKFHGMYLQDERDLRAERSKKKMEKAFSFMIRVRIPGGVTTPAQWLAMDQIARDYGNGTMRLTTRETFQLHGVIKFNARASIQKLDSVLLDTIAACGDVNRNVMTASNPHQSGAHKAAYELGKNISDYLLPRTGAYREIWLNGEKVAGGEETATVVEPIYGETYLPRKFKTVVAVPPQNDVDIFAHDLGFIAILNDKGELEGWNVTVGGGMGMTHGDVKTYPRTADVLGFVRPEHALKAAESVLTVQRDWGDRTNRAHARVKYTVEDRGLDAWRREVGRRIGVALGEPRPFKFTHTGDRYGWSKSEDGRNHLTLFIENGRIKDWDGGPRIMTGLRRIAEVLDGEFRMTSNQNVIIANISDEKRPEVERLVAEYGLTDKASPIRRNAMACVALPTCGLALAESERYLPSLITAFEDIAEKHGIADEEIVVRMTGCPNGCARPYLAEIGFVGKGPGKYNLYLGAAFNGERLSKLYLEDVGEPEILAALDPILGDFAKNRQTGEHFSDFVIRAGYIAQTGNGADFHVNTGPQRPAA
ncbi:sulfite reductase [NADPH] hemoprotein beta-component [Terrihabitans soli]|uniref:Sulfite reductase [NADPH] hemoprotein beta-component n=2 Tax=Terrihabitans soli TaxID=708113 RepID=A0A6S6QXT2_9HYPH|nr:sulfite reductase [NADPH] hemoprotein beta-component [Terrihabitans soli]